MSEGLLHGRERGLTVSGEAGWSGHNREADFHLRQEELSEGQSCENTQWTALAGRGPWRQHRDCLLPCRTPEKPGPLPHQSPRLGTQRLGVQASLWSEGAGP